MAERSQLLYMLIPFSIVVCCSGTAVGFSYDSITKTDISSIFKTLSTTLNPKQLKSFQFQVLVSNQGVVQSLSSTGESAYVHLRSYKPILITGSKTHLRSHTSKPEIPSIIVSFSSLSDLPKGNELQMLLPILLSTNSLLKGFEKVSVALPLSLLKSLNTKQRTHVDDILHYIRKSKSFLVVEESVDGEWNNSDELTQSITSLLSHTHVPIILSIKTSLSPTALNKKILSSLDNHPQIFSTPTLKLSSHRKLLTHFDLHDSLYPPSTIPTSPVYNPTTPVTNPTYNPTPTVVTIPGSSPPAFPYTTPVPITPSGTQPVTNPVTTYPPPLTVGGVPSTTSPVTTPVSTPAMAGQSWCIAKNGAPETALQSALDYACGIGGADCTTIQEGASCYNPNTLENHASYAFNSYYQKNPTATSCDFGGVAVIVNANPSSGTCVYPSSATTAAPSIIPPATTAIPSTIPPVTSTTPSTIPPATTASTSGETGTGSSYGSTPFVLNTSSSPTGSATGYGFESPPILTAPPSGSVRVRTTFFGFVVLVTSLAMAVLLGV